MNEKYYCSAFCEFTSEGIRKYFKEATGKNVKVGVVDSGWDYSLTDSRIKKGIGLIDANDELSFKISDDYNDQNGHGTSCVDLILRLAPDSCIYPIKVFGKRIETSANILIEAIKWALFNEIKIINLSLGTKLNQALEPLYRVCEYARRQGIIIISANINVRDDYSYPAIFENSIGVETGDLDNIFDIIYLKDEAIECKAKGQFTDILTLDNQRISLSGNSFASAVVTGIVTCLIEGNPEFNLDDTRECLSDYSSWRYCST